MKLTTKLLLGFGSLWSLFLIATVLALWLLKQQTDSLQEAFHRNFDSVDYCAQMVNALDACNLLALQAEWTRQRPAPDDARAAEMLFQKGAENQRHNITEPGEDALTATAMARWSDFQQAFDRFAAATQDQRIDMYQHELWPRYFAARQAVGAVSDLNLRRLRSVNVQLRQNLSRARVIESAITLIGAVLAIASTMLLARTILVPLRALIQSARRVESGNLDLRIPVRTRDELGELATAFNAMAARLQEYRQLDAARLRRTQQTTQQAIDSLPDAVAVLNPQGVVEISNREARLHFGLEPGKTTLESMPQWLRELAASSMHTGTAVEPQGYHAAVQIFDQQRHGEERFFLPRAVPMHAESGAIIGVVITLVDITRLHRADEIKRGLVATVSHELKTPLAAARFSVHLLAQDNIGPLDEKQRKLVRTACEGTDRLHRIIEDLLQFQRFEEGRQMVNAARVRPAELVRAAVDPLREEFARRGLELTVEAAPDLPEVTADGELIGHVLTNLLSNAQKFVPRGGHVLVRVELSAFAPSQVRFLVQDDGPGIPLEHQPRLFTRFYRAAAPSGTTGAGLGLAIARQLVEANGGYIGLESIPQGTRFVFTLNLASATPNPAPAPDAQSVP